MGGNIYSPPSKSWYVYAIQGGRAEEFSGWEEADLAAKLDAEERRQVQVVVEILELRKEALRIVLPKVRFQSWSYIKHE